jgi:hypothetical protein
VVGAVKVEVQVVTHTWLAFAPAYANPRGAQTQVLGAHAFRADAPRSLCGYVERAKAGGPADHAARPCVWCKSVIAGISQDRSGDDRGWSTTP